MKQSPSLATPTDVHDDIKGGKEIMRLNPTFVVPFAAECFN